MSDVLKSKILVVDDYQTMIRIIQKLLEQIGFSDIETAMNGEEALGKIKENNFDLIISDWNMDPMTGIELLKEVRTDDALSGLPFIMVTAESKPENVIAAKEAGVSNYIVKPFNADTLQKKIESVLGPV
jgi:two-component system chemotaxis response regulator CheY